MMRSQSRLRIPMVFPATINWILMVRHSSTIISLTSELVILTAAGILALDVMAAEFRSVKNNTDIPEWCPSGCFCDSENGSIECVCSQSHHLGLLDVELTREIFQEHNITYVLVQGCRNVSIITNVIKNRHDIDTFNGHGIDDTYTEQEERVNIGVLELQSLEVRNVEHLKIGHYSLAFLRNAESISIRNVSRMEMHDSPFLGSKVIRSLKFDYVGVETFYENADYLSGVEIDLVYITNCMIGTIEPFSFDMSGIHLIRITHSSFDDIKTDSLRIQDTENVELYKVYVRITRSNGICLTRIDSYSVIECTFDVAEPLAFGEDSVVESAFIIGNTIHNLKQLALLGLRASRLILLRNRFERAEENSLLLNPFLPSGGITDASNIADNTVSCDCHIDWVRKYPLYSQPLINTSMCFGPEEYAGKRLTDAVNNVDAFPCLPEETEWSKENRSSSTKPMASVGERGSFGDKESEGPGDGANRPNYMCLRLNNGKAIITFVAVVLLLSSSATGKVSLLIC